MSNIYRYSIDCFVLKRRNLGEADRMVTVYSKERGRLKIMAKGVRKIKSHRGSHIEVFHHTKMFIYKGKAYDSLTEITTTHAYDEISSDLSILSYGYYICELIDQLTPENVPQIEIFYLIKSSFDKLAKSITISEREAIITDFALNLLWNLGFLASTKKLSFMELNNYIEELSEKHLRSPRIISRINLKNNLT
jgi:DNA repair protein RecO (recombination protein O)